MRVYTVSFEDVGATLAQDLWQIEAVTVPATLHAVSISQTSDFADAEAENLVIKFRRVTDALTNVTAEAQIDPADAAALADLNVNDTTQLVTGVDTVFVEGWNIALPFIWRPPSEERFVIDVGEAMVITMSAPADSLTIHGTLTFSEIGK